MTVSLLVAARFNLEVIAAKAEAPTTVLALVPGLLAAYLVRPGEHDLVTAALGGVRVLVLATAASALTAAALLAGGVEGAGLRYSWAALIALASLALFGIAIANVRPQVPLHVRLPSDE